MSLWSLLTAAAVLPTDLVTAGFVASTAQVYPGRRPQGVTNRLGEFWLERLTAPPREGNGSQHVLLCPIRFHIRFPLNGGPNKAGELQVTTVEALMAAVVARYHGNVRFIAVSGLTGLLPATATEGTVDVDPEDAAVLEGTVDVVFRGKE